MEPLTSIPGAPDTIGPFRIVRELGRGAMGVVYLGERTEMFRQRVAIKVLRPQVSLLSGEDSLLHEESVLTSLDHPAIVRLLDSGVLANGARYLSMEYVEGVGLAEYCAEHRPAQAQTLALLLELLGAVEYAHRHLILHGDLKPENILVTADGHVKLLDFGVATLLTADGPAQGSVHLTPAFASPEQLAGQRLTAAADIYSLGLIARWMFAAGAGGNQASRDLAAILDKATRPEADQRYGTVREFADDLRASLAHRPVAARRGSRTYVLSRWVRRHRTAGAMAALIMLVLAGSVVGVAFQTARAARQRRIAEDRLYDLVRLTGSLDGRLYDSLRPLPQATAARAALLSASADTLHTVSRSNSADPSAALELAAQYDTLARLQLAEPSPRNDAGIRAELEQGEVLLRSIPRSSRDYAQAQARLAAMLALQHALRP